jgi:oxaloacetate decarboxylase beta subunit
MENFHVLSLFEGVSALLQMPISVAIGRIVLVLLGFLMIYLGRKGTLEPLLMIPMGLGMATINVSTMFFDPLNLHHGLGNLFVEPQAGATTDAVRNAADLMTIMQIDWLQPIYTFTFSNGLIACFVFMGIGSLLDIGYVIARPFSSMLIALFAELGTVFTLPIAEFFGFSTKQAAAISSVGGADGPMVLVTSLKLAPELFVPIAIVAYLYLGLAYGAFPYLVRALIPKHIRSIKMDPPKGIADISSGKKIAIAVVACVVLCFLLPVAAPLIFCLFFGVVIRESGIRQFVELLQGPVLYLSTMFLGMTLGILCDAGTIMDPKVLPLLLLGMFSLTLSGVGGIMGGYVMYFITKGKYNPVIGIAGVSCVPSTAKVAQKIVSKDNPFSMIMPYALGANVTGVITTAIITGLFINLLK